jgi:hypothetical protein
LSWGGRAGRASTKERVVVIVDDFLEMRIIFAWVWQTCSPIQQCSHTCIQCPHATT